MPKISPKEIIMVFVLLIIGASLLSPIADIVFTTTHYQNTWANGTFNGTYVATNVTGASASIIGLLALFFVIVLIMIAVKKIRD